MPVFTINGRKVPKPFFYQYTVLQCDDKSLFIVRLENQSNNAQNLNHFSAGSAVGFATGVPTLIGLRANFSTGISEAEMINYVNNLG